MGDFGKKLGRLLTGAFAVLLLAAAPTAALAQGDVTRLGGTDRYATMSSVVSEGFGSSTWAVISTGDNYPDALAASALAGVRNCPVILTRGGGLSPQARSQIERLGVTDAYVMGGTNAIGPDTEAQIRALGVSVTRVAGTERTATSVEAMRTARAAGSTSDTVVIATGYNFADSLSMGPWSYRTKSPLVLAGRDGRLSDSAVEAIKADASIRRVVVVGGTSAVSAAVESQLGGGYSYQRIAGSDRYETSVRIAEWEAANGLTWDHPAIATGENYPDALAGSALCGSNRSPLVLVSRDGGVGVSLIRQHMLEANGLYILGGTAAVSAEVEGRLSGSTAADQTSYSGTSTSSAIVQTGNSSPETQGRQSSRFPGTADDGSRAGANTGYGRADGAGADEGDGSTHKVTFVSQGVTIGAQSVKDAEPASAPPAPESAGKVFMGWDKDLSSIKEDVTVQAIFAAQPRGYAFSADKEGVNLGVPEPITFYVDTNGASRPASVTVSETTDGQVAALNDSGTNGDVTANDGIYSGTYTPISEKNRVATYYASADGSVAGSLEVTLYRELSKEQIEAVTRIGNGASALSFEQARKYIARSGDVSSYMVDQQRQTITCFTDAGIEYVWAPQPKEGFFGGDSLALTKQELSNLSLISDEWKALSDRVKEADFTSSLRNRKIAVVLPVFDESDASYTVGTYLRMGAELVADSIGGTVDVYEGGELTDYVNQESQGLEPTEHVVHTDLLHNINRLHEYDIVIWNTHGEVDQYGRNFLDSGSKMNYSISVGMGLNYDLGTTFLRFISLNLTKKNFVIRGWNDICVTGDYFKDNYPSGSLDNAYWFLGACKSMQTTHMADSLIGLGAAAVTGYSDFAYADYIMRTFFRTVINRMLLGADTIGEAYKFTISSHYGTWKDVESEHNAIAQIKPTLECDIDNANNRFLIAPNADNSYRIVDSITAKGQQNDQDVTVTATADRNNLKVGESAQITATTSPAGKALAYTSSDTSVITVDDAGKVLAVGPGKATITVVVASSPTVSATVEFTVADSSQQPDKSEIIASGTWGTCRWEIDAQGVLTVHPGRIPDTLPSKYDAILAPWLNHASEIKSAVFISENGAKVVAQQHMHTLFKSCSKMVSCDLSGLDTSNVTYMGDQFAFCSSLAALDLSGWDTSKVTSMASMFAGCSSLASIDFTGWDTSNVTDMSCMFSGCSSLAALDLSGWDTSKVTVDYKMFSSNSSLASVKVGQRYQFMSAHMVPAGIGAIRWSSKDQKWYTASEIARSRSGVADTYLNHEGAVEGESKLLASGVWGTCPWEIDEDGVLTVHPGVGADTDSERHPSWSAYQKQITSVRFVPKGGRKVVAPASCANLFGPIVGGVVNVTLYGSITTYNFYDRITSADLSGLDTSNVTNVTNMFVGCISLTSFKVGESYAIKSADMFPNATAEGGKWWSTKDQKWYTKDEIVQSRSGIADTYTSTETDKHGTAGSSGEWGNCTWNISPEGELRVSPKPGTDGKLAGARGYGNLEDRLWFPWSARRESIKSAVFEKGVELPENCCGMFAFCTNLSSIDLSGWDTSSVIDLSYVFWDCSSLTSLDVAGWNTSSTLSMDGLFRGCSKLVSVDVSKFRTSRVGSMLAMFYGCSSLTTLDLSGWDTSSVKNVAHMFSGCKSLASLDLSSWDTSHVTGMDSMFGGCSSLSSFKVGESYAIKSADMFPDAAAEGTKWLSTRDRKLYTKDEIVSSRSGFADTYTSTVG